MFQRKDEEGSSALAAGPVRLLWIWLLHLHRKAAFNRTLAMVVVAYHVHARGCLAACGGLCPETLRPHRVDFASDVGRHALGRVNKARTTREHENAHVIELLLARDRRCAFV